ncbi:unnamed protein product [Leptosia nina]|uniref:C2H2-type domain-containing protein n=1 Tax=Leptosia nina TaxID=320188 RepID=A0AAV1J8I0_9NEOP
MRNIDTNFKLGDKIDEAVSHYIETHQNTEAVDANSLSLNVQDDGGGRVVTVMHPQSYSQQVCRQVSVGEQMGDGPWVEELLDGRLAALVAHLAQPSRSSHHHGQTSHHKIPTTIRGDVDTSVILDGSMRLFSSHSLEQHHEALTVQVSDLPTLPPLQDMKRCPDTSWFNKDKNSLKENGDMLLEDSQVLEMSSGSPMQCKQNKKSLPHKKRISRKLKRNTGNTTPSQEDIVFIQCNDEVQQEQEEIHPDSFVDPLVRHQETGHIPDTHVPHIRAVLVCQLCGQFYGEEQLKFYQHLRHHYEPQTSIIMENPVVPDIGIDKISNTCIVDNGVTLPDSIVELSLEGTVPKTIYQAMDKHIVYDKQLYKYSMGIDKDVEGELDDTLDKLELYCCVKCNKSFRKQKQCEAHIREVHASKIEDMGEFSEPEDLMEGIHVAVDEGEHEQEQHEQHEQQHPDPTHDHEVHEQSQEQHAQYDTVLPHLTVENGHVHQEHVRHWYSRSGGESPEVGPLCACGGAGCCPVCAPPYTHQRPYQVTKEEVLERILENEEQQPEPPPPRLEKPHSDTSKSKKKTDKKFECVQCGRVFEHRNSMVYHLLMHNERKHPCLDCGKRFYTSTSLKVHKRTHDGVKPCECTVCGQRFRRNGDLKYHTASKHSNEKLFKCEFCNKEFARRYSLNIHRRIHTGERNYKCDFCPKSFRAASYKQIHMRTHTGLRPYQCAHCDKCFRVSYDMRRHVRVVHEKSKKDDEVKKQTEKTTKKDDKQKNKDDKKKVAKKPPNVTIQNKAVKLNQKDLQRRDGCYLRLSDYEEKTNIKMESELLKNQNGNAKIEFRENTDGEMPIFSQVEKVTANHIPMGTLKNVDINRERELPGDIEMFDKLAFYNIPAV